MNKTEINTTLKNLFINNKNEYFIIDAENDKKYTYSDFLILSLNIKNYLNSIGIFSSDTFAYICQNSIYTLALYFANLLNGSIIAPIDPNKGKCEIDEIIQSKSFKSVIKYDDLIDLKIINQNYNNTIFDELDFNLPLQITFTSGSTGVSKGVLHSFKNLYYSAYYFGEKFKFSDKNIFYHNFPMAYMAGILNLFVKPMVCGSKIVIDKRQSAASAMNFWNKIIKYKVNTFWFNPTFLALLLKLDRDSNGIEYTKTSKIIACVGTAPLSYTLKTKFENKYNFELYESYGLSETLFLTTNYPNNNKENSVGEILEQVNIKINNRNEILVKTPCQMIKYINSNTSKDPNEYFNTGDVGKIINKKYLSILGRTKDIIIKGGNNISPKKIEEFITKYFEEAVIIGLNDDILGEKIGCFYTDKNISTKIQKDVNNEIKEKLGKDYTIDYFKNLDIIPKNINGKIDKNIIKKGYEIDN